MSTVPRILFVTPDLRLMHTSLLLSQGYEVEHASTLAEARLKLRPGAYDLVLISVNGDHPDVLAFCEEVKHQEPQLLVALVSDFHTYLPEEECSDGIVRTSYDPAGFLRQVEALLGTQPWQKM